ncbi:MAG: hypothetical protein K6G23_08390 [Lachnospiraceae bacterium]|nr:hypothetical protein [Lachnospiraceae bacterium]
MNDQTPGIGKLLLKTLFFAFVMLFGYLSISVLFYQVRDSVTDQTINADQLRWLDTKYYGGDYAGLYSTMILYGLYDDELYQSYWEMIDASQDYYDCMMWNGASQNGYAGAPYKAASYYEQLLYDAANCKYSFNQALIDQLVDAVTAP